MLRTNRYGEYCWDCGAVVPAGQGFYHGTTTVKVSRNMRCWRETRHEVTCQFCQAVRDHKHDKEEYGELQKEDKDLRGKNVTAPQGAPA